MKRYYLLFFCFIFSSCAHYFEKENITKVEHNIEKTKSICIRSGKHLSDSVILASDSERFGKIYKLVETKYGMNMNCENTTDLNLLIYDDEKEEWGDWWKATIGIIPGVYSKNWYIKIYSPQNNLVLDKQSNGKIIISLFFTPFFFLYKGPDEIIFEELDKYLKKQKLILNQPIQNL